MSKSNAQHQREWYLRQKLLYGQVYLITFVDGETYVGSTTNSLTKRRWHHNHWANAGKESPLHQHIRLLGKDYQMETLYTCVKGDNLKAKEQYYIQELQPTLNRADAKHRKDATLLTDAIRQDWKYRKGYVKDCKPVKDGVEFAGFFFPSKYCLWETCGKTPYNTFKTRLHRGYTIRQALGMEPLKTKNVGELGE